MKPSADPEEEEEGLGRSKFNIHCFLNGGMSTFLPTLVAFPVYKTVFRQQINNHPLPEAVGQLFREGPRKLYRGVGPPLLMQTLKGTLLFGLQEAILHQLPLSSQSVISTSALPALAGFGAGLVEAVVFTPFERVQNVLQDGRNYRDLPTLKSVLVRLRGQTLTLGYYRAFLPIAARNALGSSIYFGLKGPVCAAVAGEWCHPMASSFVSGALTSLVGSLAIYPLSVLVANMQAQPGGEVKGVMASWRMLWMSREQSVALLYRGGSLVIFRSCIIWGITTALYDRQKKLSG
ncbi:solute carrier family 25 member 53 [Pleuronectes platessa]|uniref:solute carrier family 25 member 53 n=1 Tax=Pleuronectes platessa TaxID=8262 RepID=UPI00232A4436|nr:solute carrier family 25 member 53 [Pleuronectes platessa]